MAAAMLVDPCIKRRDRWTWLVEGRAEIRDTCTVAGRAPRGVMLLGATYIIASQKRKVKFSPSSISRKDRKWSQVPPPRFRTARKVSNSAGEEQDSSYVKQVLFVPPWAHCPR